AGLFLTAIIFFTYAVTALKGKPRPLAQADLIDILLIGAFPLYMLFTANEYTWISGDNLASRNLAPLILAQKTIDLSSLRDFQGPDLPYSATPVRGRILPAFPIGTSILSLPYAAAANFVSSGNWNDITLLIREKHFAAIASAFSVLLFFLAVRHRF